jgi:hypothetical protein
MKQTIIDALDRWIRQRPGLEFGNYGSVPAYRAEMRSITRDLHHARELLLAVSNRSISADAIIEAARHAYSGRLSITPQGDTVQIDYCTGQYWPTEYRRAVCAVLSFALWDYWRADHSSGDAIRAEARRSLSRSVVNRFFR